MNETDNMLIVLESIHNGQRPQARAQIRAYGVTLFFKHLQDIEYITPDRFIEIWNLYNWSE